MYYFQAYGLTFRSALMLPGYQLLTPSQRPDVVLSIGKDLPLQSDLFFHAHPDEIGLNVPNIARFLIKNGERIWYEPAPGVCEDSLTAFLGGPCLAALLMQRNLFVLNGSVLNVNGAAVAYIGESCSGKSLTTTVMMQRGHLVMADGLCVINEAGMVFPGPNHIELWEDANQFLMQPIHLQQAIRPGINKYRVSLNEAFYDKPLTLQALFVFTPQKEEGLSYQNLQGSEKINFLQKNIYNKSYLNGLKKNQLYFEYCAKLAQQTFMTSVKFNGVKLNLSALTQCIIELQDVK